MPRKLKIIFCFLLPLVALHSQPQEAKTLVLKSAWLYDGKSDRMMSPGLVVVRGAVSTVLEVGQLSRPVRL